MAARDIGTRAATHHVYRGRFTIGNELDGGGGSAHSVSVSEGDDIQAALDEMVNGQTLFIGPGVYEISAPLTVTNRVSIIGSGFSTVLRAADGLNDDILTYDGVEAALVTQLTFEGNSANNGSGALIVLNDSQLIMVTNCLLRDNVGGTVNETGTSNFNGIANNIISGS